MYKKSKDHLLNVFRQMMTKDSFVQNSAYMFFSSGSAILIQFAFFPILSRIYSPEAYGLFGVLNFYTSALGSSATLSLNQALVLPKEQKQFVALLRLNILVTILVCGFVTLVTLVAGPSLMKIAHTESIGGWVYLIGPIGLVIALDRIVVEWAVREKVFKKITTWSTINAIGNKLFNLGYGTLVNASAAGLVITNVLLYGLHMVSYCAFVVPGFRKVLSIPVTRDEIKESAREYRNFPKFMFWGNFINLISANVPSIMLPVVGFGLNHVGYFNYSLLLLDLPIRMLGAGVSSVFLPKANEMFRERSHELAPATWKLFRMMLLISIAATGLVFFLGEPLYKLFFGANWGEAGKAAEILSIYYYFRLLSAPLAVVYNVMKREREFFFFQVVLFILRIASLYLGDLITDDFFEMMAIFSAVNAICHIWLCLRIFRLTGIDMKKGIALTTGSAIFVFGLGYLLKNWLFS